MLASAQQDNLFTREKMDMYPINPYDHLQDRQQCRQAESHEIMAIIPGASGVMILDAMERYSVGMTTIRIWAAQGALMLIDGRLKKVSPPEPSESEILAAVQALKALR